jgi:ATP-binding cassette subfamily B protein RaxB
MISMALLALANLAFYPVIRARSEELIRSVANEQTLLMETVRAITTIKLMGREAEREGVWRNAYAKTINASVSLGRFQISLNFIDNVIIGLQTVLVVFLGAKTILQAEGFSVGMLMAFLSFRQTFSDRATSLVTQGLQFRLLGLHLERLGDIIAQEAEQTGGFSHTLEVAGGVVATNIAFRYGATDPWVFQNLDLSIAPGEFVAVTGASGNGKTTLLKVLLGLQPPSVGQLTLDGHSATPGVWRSWRAQVGVVAQDDKLLSGTLADNIAFFDPDLSMSAVAAAAKAAQVHGDIMAKPMQYRSLVGDMGSTLSGGQYQRILLARALYRNPKILILDEGTANLDEVTEAAIADLVSQLPITRIVVSHRPALVLRAQRVLRMQEGALEDITDQWRDRRHQIVRAASA